LLFLAKGSPGDPATCESIAKGKAAWPVLNRWLMVDDQAGRSVAEVLSVLAAEPLVRRSDALVGYCSAFTCSVPSKRCDLSVKQLSSC